MKACDLFVVAGEASGDAHAAKLVEKLKKRIPDLSVLGVGGEKLQNVGMELFEPMCSVMGFSAVLKALPNLFFLFKRIEHYVIKKKPRAVLMVDSPDFNLRLAKALRQAGYKGRLIQYICPSVWAWRKGRIQDMTQTLDLLLSIFPFEAKYFEKTGLRVEYAGNPTLEDLENHVYDHNWTANLPFSVKKEHLLGLFPGSRKAEIQQNLPKQLAAAEVLLKEHPKMQVGISLANTELQGLVQKFIRHSTLNLQENLFILDADYRFELMRASRLAIATCGTVTLELGLQKTPTTAVYHVGTLNYFIAKFLFGLNLPHYCLVNIVLQQRVFPELVHKDFTTQNLYLRSKELYQHTALRKDCMEKCQELRRCLFLEKDRAAHLLEEILQ